MVGVFFFLGSGADFYFFMTYFNFQTMSDYQNSARTQLLNSTGEKRTR